MAFFCEWFKKILSQKHHIVIFSDDHVDGVFVNNIVCLSLINDSVDLIALRRFPAFARIVFF